MLPNCFESPGMFIMNGVIHQETRGCRVGKLDSDTHRQAPMMTASFLVLLALLLSDLVIILSSTSLAHHGITRLSPAQPDTVVNISSSKPWKLPCLPTSGVTVSSHLPVGDSAILSGVGASIGPFNNTLTRQRCIQNSSQSFDTSVDNR